MGSLRTSAQTRRKETKLFSRNAVKTLFQIGVSCQGIRIFQGYPGTDWRIKLYNFLLAGDLQIHPACPVLSRLTVVSYVQKCARVNYILLPKANLDISRPCDTGIWMMAHKLSSFMVILMEFLVSVSQVRSIKDFRFSWGNIVSIWPQKICWYRVLVITFSFIWTTPNLQLIGSAFSRHPAVSDL